MERGNTESKAMCIVNVATDIDCALYWLDQLTSVLNEIGEDGRSKLTKHMFELLGFDMSESKPNVGEFYLSALLSIRNRLSESSTPVNPKGYKLPIKAVASITIVQDPSNPDMLDDLIKGSLARDLIKELENGGYITYEKRAGDIPGTETTTASVNVVKTKEEKFETST